MRNIFLQQFSDTVWYCVFVMIGVGFLVYTVNVPFERKWQTDVEFNAYGLLLMWECILLQGPAKTFQSSCMNIVIISSCMFGILLVQFYGAYVVASLLTNAPHTITNLQKLNRSSITFGIENNSWSIDLFNQAKSELEKDVAHKVWMHNRLTVLEMWDGLQKISKGDFAFHMDVNKGYYTLKSALNFELLFDYYEQYFSL